MSIGPVSGRLRDALAREFTRRPLPISVSAKARHNDEMVRHVLKRLSEVMREISASTPEESGHHAVGGGR